MATASAASKSGETVILPGNSTKSDLVEIMKMAVAIIRDPDKFSASNRQGCAISLELFVRGVT